MQNLAKSNKKRLLIGEILEDVINRIKNDIEMYRKYTKVHRNRYILAKSEKIALVKITEKSKKYQKNLFLHLTKAKMPFIIGLQFETGCMHLMQNCDMHSSVVPIGGFPFL